jgi:DNA-binding transcriptional MerR regulator
MDYVFNVTNDEFKSFGHYAKKFGVKVSTVNYWAENYGLPYIKPGSQKYTTDKAFTQWLAMRDEPVCSVI